MAYPFFSPIPFDHNEVYEKEEAAIKGKQDLFSMEVLGQVDPLYSEYSAYQENSMTEGLNFYGDRRQQQQQEQRAPLGKSSYLTLDDYFSSCFQEPAPQKQQQQEQRAPLGKSSYLTLDDYFSSCFQEPAPQMQQKVKKVENIMKPSKEMSQSSSLSSYLELLNNYGSGIKKLNVNPNGNPDNQTNPGTRKRLSAEEIMRVAGERYIQFSVQRNDGFSMLMHPFGCALWGLSEEETKDVELAHVLLAAAEMVGYQQYDRAGRLLARCEWIASERSNPLQRVVYYFAEALRERIDKATGKFMPKELEGEVQRETHGLSSSLAGLVFYQNIPFNQIMHLTSIQAIIESVGSARKLHLIDLEIRSGVQWTALMQALAERVHRRLEHLKVTALSCLKEKEKVEQTGKRLESFAKSLNFPFTFRAVYVSCMTDVKEEMFQTAADESVVVVACLILRKLILMPDCLENLMRVIKNLNPSLMLVSEVEANHNSPTFENRFVEALFFYTSYFDCIDSCWDQSIEHRLATEATLSIGIRNIVATEGQERIDRSVKIDVWRAFFSRFRMVEVEFSESSLYQAGLVHKRFPSAGNSCTIEKNDKCLILSWKGTPVHSLSVWKFQKQKFLRDFQIRRLNSQTHQ